MLGQATLTLPSPYILESYIEIKITKFFYFHFFVVAQNVLEAPQRSVKIKI